MVGRSRAVGRRTRGSFAVTLAATLVFLLSLAQPALAADLRSQEDHGTVTIEGRIRLTAIDYPDHASLTASVETEDGTNIPLVGLSQASVASFDPGARVRVTGAMLRSGGLQADSRPTLLSPADLPPNENLGEQVTLAIMANFRNDKSTPKTEQDVRNVISGTGDKIVREYSYGQAWITLNVTGWHTMDLDSTCDQSSILQPAIDAADPSVDFKLVTRLTILFPAAGCGYLGVATVGSRSINTQDGTIQASVLWIPSNGWNAGVWVHEHGHNFGVWHANSLSCGGKSFGEVGTGGCTTQDYGDPWESMGNKATAHYDSYHKRDIGWLWSNRSVTATKGTFDIEPIAKLPGALGEVVVPYDASNYYTIEMRVPFGQDVGETGNLFKGAVIHFAPWKSSTGDSHIIDTTHTTSSVTDSALEVGKTYNDSLKNIEITTLSINSTHLRVRVGPDTGDSSPPTVRIVFPVDQGGVGSTSITVNGTASDNTGVTQVQVSVNGAAFTPASGTGTWSIPGTVAGGANGICARAFDASGNMGQHCVTAWLDAAPPTVAISSPKDGDFSNTSTVAVAGTAKDDVRLDFVEVQANGGAWAKAAGAASWTSTVQLKGGPNTICARATDTAVKQSAPACVNVGVDADPPQVAILSPTDGGAVADPAMTVTGNASDDVEVAKVEVQVGGGAWSIATGTTSWTASVTIQPGVNSLCARATDKAGKVATSTPCPKVTLDQTPPTVKITAPADGANVPAEGLLVTGTAADNVKVAKVEVQLNSGVWEPANGTTSWTRMVNLPTAGVNKICARAVDIAGNTGSGADCVTVDSRPPRVLGEVRVSPATSDLDPMGTLQLTAEAFDTAGSGLDPLVVQWRWSILDGKGSVDQTGLFTAVNQSGKVRVKVTGTFNGVTKEAIAEVYVGGGSPAPGGGGGGFGPLMGFLVGPLFLIILAALVGLIVAGAVVSARRKKKRPAQVYYEESFPQM